MTRAPRSRKKKSTVANRPALAAVAEVAAATAESLSLPLQPPEETLEAQAPEQPSDTVAETVDVDASGEVDMAAAADVPVAAEQPSTPPAARSSMRIEMTEDRTHLGQRLRAARDARGWSREDVAHRLHVPTTVVADIEAERFERWLFEEVLPTIRQTGAYALPGASSAVVASIADLRSQLEMIAKLVKWAEPMLADLEAQVGGASRPAVPIQPRHQKPTRRRSIAPADIWESDVRAFMADRQEVTTTLVLDYLAVPPADQTQVSKNWIARILKNMGFVSCVVKRGGRTHRVWQRNH